MKFRKTNRTRPNKIGLIVGITSILIAILTFMYFFDRKAINFKSTPYNQLITDQKFYSKSSIIDWHKINLGPFKIQTPKDYKFYRMEGIDSYIGGITNQTDTFLFDYGWYSNELDRYKNSNLFEISLKKINGKVFKIVSEKSEIGFIGAYTEDLKKNNKLSIVCLNCNNLSEKRNIITTIEFNQ